MAILGPASEKKGLISVMTLEACPPGALKSGKIRGHWLDQQTVQTWPVVKTGPTQVARPSLVNFRGRKAPGSYTSHPKSQAVVRLSR